MVGITVTRARHDVAKQRMRRAVDALSEQANVEPERFAHEYPLRETVAQIVILEDEVANLGFAATARIAALEERIAALEAGADKK